MSKRLALDTSGTEYVIALMEDGHLVGAEAWRRTRGPDEIPILSRIVRLLRAAQWPLDQLQAIAAGRGPGSFTGLRVGISVAAGLAYGRQIPLYLSDSLEMLARRPRDMPATAVLRDAGRGETYAWRPQSGPTRLHVAALAAWLQPNDRVLVDPAGLLGRWAPGMEGLEVPSAQQRPLAEALAETANLIIGREKPVRYDEVQPLYLQPAAAEERRGSQS